MSELMANMEAIDRSLSLPSPILDCMPALSDDLAEPVQTNTPHPQPRRISRLGPVSLRPCAEAGPSRDKGERFMYIGVRSGEVPKVYTDWREAEAQLLNRPSPAFKTFSTKMAADAYVKGWDGAGRHSVPGSCPKPLREHLAMNFPSSVPLSSSTPKRPSYHARLVASAPTLSVLPESTELSTFDSRRHSFRQSQVRVSSPLCRQVDEEPSKSKQPNWAIGPNGLLSPPSSPDKAFTTSIVNRERPTTRKSLTESGLWASAPRRDFQRPTSLLSKSSSSSLNSNQPPPTNKASCRSSGLWTDSVPLPQPSSNDPTPDLASSAPKFSRSAMRKSGVVMPASAPRTNSSSSIRSRLSRTPSSTSLSSLASSSSSLSLQTLRRPTVTPKNSQDRLSTLAETSIRESRVDEHGMLAFGSLAPPRPSFMKRTNSSSSVSSIGSGRSVSSMGSLTSASSACMSSLDSCSPIQEEDDGIQIRVGDNRLPITCTKSDADAASQSSAEKKPKKGGLFKRLSRAFKKEKEEPAGQDANRRGSH